MHCSTASRQQALLQQSLGVIHCIQCLRQEAELHLQPHGLDSEAPEGQAGPLQKQCPPHAQNLMAPHDPGKDAEPKFHDKLMNLHSLPKLLTPSARCSGLCGG